jgi:hypothetical protein
VSLPLVKALQQCQSVTAARISASRCGLYQLGVKPCTSSPWSWAKVTSAMGSEEHHDASHTTSSTSAHRNLKRREYWSGKVPAAAGLTISAPSQTAPAGPAAGASNRRLRRCSYAPALSRSQAATGRRHDVNKVLPRVLSASTGGRDHEPRVSAGSMLVVFRDLRAGPGLRGSSLVTDATSDRKRRNPYFTAGFAGSDRSSALDRRSEPPLFVLLRTAMTCWPRALLCPNPGQCRSSVIAEPRSCVSALSEHGSQIS